MNPPNLGTLAVLSQFDNPMRQPMIVDSVGWSKAYAGITDGRCTAAILPTELLGKYDGGARLTRVIYRTKPMPNQAFSAGPRVSPDDQAKIAAALTASEALTPTLALRAAYGSDRGFARAQNQDYAGLDSYLRDIWGYAR